MSNVLFLDVVVIESDSGLLVFEYKGSLIYQRYDCGIIYYVFEDFCAKWARTLEKAISIIDEEGID